MKKVFNEVMFCVLLVAIGGCSQESNEKATIDWIAKAKKPITCTAYGSNDFGVKWTLIDDSGKVYQTGFVFLRFPEKIGAKDN